MAPVNYPELVVPAVIALFCILYVLPWHIRVRNLATLSMTFWMASINFTHIINRKHPRASDPQYNADGSSTFSIALEL